MRYESASIKNIASNQKMDNLESQEILLDSENVLESQEEIQTQTFVQQKIKDEQLELVRKDIDSMKPAAATEVGSNTNLKSKKIGNSFLRKTALALGLTSALVGKGEASSTNAEKISSDKQVNISEAISQTPLDANNISWEAAQKDSLSEKNVPDYEELKKELDNLIQLNPYEILIQFDKFKDIPDLDINGTLSKVVDYSPSFFLNNIDSVKNIAGLDFNGLIAKAIENNSEIFLDNVNNFKDIKDLNLASLVTESVEKEPYYYIKNINNLKDILGLDFISLTDMAFSKTPQMLFRNINDFKDIPSLDLSAIVTDAALNNSLEFVEKINDLKDIQGIKLSELAMSVAETSASYIILNNKIKNFEGIDNLDLTDFTYQLAKSMPYLFFNNIYIFEDINNLDLVKVISLVSEEDPGQFFENFDRFKDMDKLDLPMLIAKAGEKAPEQFFYKIDELKKVPNLNLVELINKFSQPGAGGFLYKINELKNIPGLNLAEMVTVVAAEKPLSFISNIKDFKDIEGLDLASLVMKANNFVSFDFSNFSNFKGIKGLALDSLITKAAAENPKEILRNSHLFSDVEGLDLANLVTVAAIKEPETFFENAGNVLSVKNLDKVSLINSMAEKSPALFLNNLYYFSSDSGVNLEKLILEASDKDYDAFLNNLYDVESATNSLVLKKKVSDAFKSLIDISANPDNPQKEIMEPVIMDYSLRSVQEVNDLHTNPNSDVRFASIKDDAPKELYTKMVYGEQEIFTSTFNGIFNELKAGMQKDGISGRQLLDQVGDNKFRTFIKECTGFNRLNDFLATMSEDDANNLLKEVVKNLEQTEDKLAQAVTVADIFGNVNDPKTLKILQEQVKSEYERISPDSIENRAIYGLLASMFSDVATVEADWFKKIGKEYPNNKVTELKSSELFNDNGVCVQKYCFFESGDGDGVSSYESFIKTYEKDLDSKGGKKWVIDKNNEGFVIIKGEQGGRVVEIYANVPQIEERGISGLVNMDDFMQAQNLQANVYSYRGHSFGFTLDGDLSKTKLINVGSCGGYNNLLTVLEQSPAAHIISTQGTGTKLVNDPLFNRISNLILNGQDLSWKKVWDELPGSVKSNENFKSYVSPDKNQGAMFVKSYNDLIANQSKELTSN